MCRHLAYVGQPVRLGELVAEPPFSLVRQSWAPRHQSHGVVNADGFGIGWYVDGLAEPARHRAAGPIWADETFPELCRVISSTAVLAAVRSATIGMAPGQAAAAPFRSGKWLFSHNGAVNGWPAVASRLAWGLDPVMVATLEAPTDSALLWAMTRDLLGRGKPPEAALSEVLARSVDAGGGRLTMLLTDGRQIAATVWGTSLWWRQLPGSTSTSTSTSTLPSVPASASASVPASASMSASAPVSASASTPEQRVPQQRAGGTVVASEPYDDDPSWIEVPDGSLLVADAAGAVVEPLR